MADPTTFKYFGEEDTKKLILLIKDEFAKYVKKKEDYDLSKNDFTDELKKKLDEIAEGANKVEVTANVTEGTTIATIKLSEDETVAIKVKSEEVITIDTEMSDTSTNPVQNKVIKAYVDDKVSAVYRPKGSVAFAGIPTSDMEEGDVYNITDAFTTDDRFVEGAGHKYPAGTNIVYTSDSKWDVLAGFIDLSGYVLKTDLVAIAVEDLTTWWNEQFNPTT